jgi:hypothetical protein
MPPLLCILRMKSGPSSNLIGRCTLPLCRRLICRRVSLGRTRANAAGCEPGEFEGMNETELANYISKKMVELGIEIVREEASELNS